MEFRKQSFQIFGFFLLYKIRGNNTCRWNPDKVCVLKYTRQEVHTKCCSEMLINGNGLRDKRKVLHTPALYALHFNLVRPMFWPGRSPSSLTTFLS